MIEFFGKFFIYFLSQLKIKISNLLEQIFWKKKKLVSFLKTAKLETSRLVLTVELYWFLEKKVRVNFEGLIYLP